MLPPKLDPAAVAELKADNILSAAPATMVNIFPTIGMPSNIFAASVASSPILASASAAANPFSARFMPCMTTPANAPVTNPAPPAIFPRPPTTTPAALPTPNSADPAAEPALPNMPAPPAPPPPPAPPAPPLPAPPPAPPPPGPPRPPPLIAASMALRVASEAAF